MPEITMHKVESSNIAARGYDPATNTLRVKFTSGATYDIADVSPESYDDFCKAPSAGKFYSANYRSKPATRIG